MVGEVAVVEPVLPVVGRPGEPLVRLLVRPRRRVLRPGEGDEERLALLHQRPGGGPRALEADAHARRQPQA